MADPPAPWQSRSRPEPRDLDHPPHIPTPLPSSTRGDASWGFMAPPVRPRASHELSPDQRPAPAGEVEAVRFARTCDRAVQVVGAWLPGVPGCSGVRS
jgi:hypothetical protein